jgi:tRNA-dihydrouridine synthase B
MVQDAGAAAVTIHGRTAEQSYSGSADWNLVEHVSHALTIPVLGSGDCVEPQQVVERLSIASGVLVGRGVLRNPWILAQAADMAAGRQPRTVTLSDRGQFLRDYIALLRADLTAESDGFRHVAPGSPAAEADAQPARGHDRWVINKLRALCSWYSKGLEGGSNLRVRVNSASSIDELHAIIEDFFFSASAGDQLIPAGAANSVSFT